MASLAYGGPDRGGGTDRDAVPTDLSDLLKLGRSTFELGLSLERTLAADGELAGRNVVTSPYSVYEALGLVYAGARGETAREIADVLHYGLQGEKLAGALTTLHAQLTELDSTTAASSPAHPDVLLANAIFAQVGFDIEPAYKALARERYAGIAESVDFGRAPDQARERINGWIKRRTRGLVPELFAGGSLASSTALVVVNAAYLRGTWEEPFPRSSTHAAPFEKGDGRRMLLPTMHGVVNAGYLQAPDYQAAELRYVGDRLSLLLLLPARGKFREVEQRLTADGLSELAESLPRARRKVRVALPKFELTVPLSLRASLTKLGMKRAFGSDADFTGMSRSRAGALFIGQIRHQSHLAVDEVQTEAAAASGVVMSYSAAAPEVTLEVDRPFFLGIHDKKTGVLLFWGRILDPSAG